jgi:hypothetical protein
MLIKQRGRGGCAEIYGEETFWKITTWNTEKEMEINVEIYHRETIVEDVNWTKLVQELQRSDEIYKMARFRAIFF